MPMVTIDDVRSAARRVAGMVVRTPLLACPWGDPGRPLWVKAESLQPVGVFKLRGAGNAVAMLDDGQRSRGVVTHSSGNHARALAWAGRAAGMHTLIALFGYLGEQDRPELWQADGLIHEPGELLGWLNGMRTGATGAQ